MREFYPIGTKVKTIECKHFTDDVNEEQKDRIGTIVDITFPFGLHTVYHIQLDKPYKDRFGYDVDNYSFYDFNNAFVAIKE